MNKEKKSWISICVLAVICLALLIVFILQINAQKKAEIDYTIRSESVEPDIITAETMRRIYAIAEQDEAYNLFEITPFVWDTYYSYFAYYSEAEYDELVGELSEVQPFIPIDEEKIFLKAHQLFENFPEG